MDKWLWHSRFYKSRSIAATEIRLGKFRVNGIKIAKPSRLLKEGDIIIFFSKEEFCAVKVLNFTERRCSATEAHTLYQNLLWDGL